MKIRDAISTDAAQVADIYNHYVRTSVITFEETPVSNEEMAGRIAEVQALSFPWLIAEIDESIAGFAYANKWKVRAAYRHSCEITVYVRAGLGASGVGTALYEKLFPILKSKGLHSAIGGIALPNEASVKLHEKFGLRKVAHFEEVGFKLDRWVDVAYWQTTL